MKAEGRRGKRAARTGQIGLVLLILLAFLPWQASVASPVRGDDLGDQQIGMGLLLAGVTEAPARQPAAPATQPATATASPATASSATVSGDATRTSIRIDLSRGVTAEIFTLADPYRVIVDLPDVVFKLPDTAGQESRGLVKAFRFGLFAERKARLVFDVTGPVGIERAAMANGEAGGIVFTFDLVPMNPETFGKGTGIDHHTRDGSSSADQPAPDPTKPKKNKHRPVVVIDPGHGGIDGGAQGPTNVLEKNIVLAVARELAAALAKAGRYDVHMTRTKDVFVSLDQRLRISEQLGADLFVSLHADSLADEGFAQSVRGATVYTLSEKASDEQARRMAEKENASDLLAGLAPRETEGADQVKNILIDLMKRETANFSADFSKVLIQNFRRKANLSKDPSRHASFKVLKQTHAPSVLIELGYLSNTEDERLLASPDWQRQMAAAIATSVEAFFAKRSPGNDGPMAIP